MLLVAMQRPLRDDARVHALDQLRRQRVQAGDELVGGGHALDQAPGHHAVRAVAEQDVPALHEAVPGEVLA